VAYPLIGLANLYYEQGNYVQAESLYQRALTIWEYAHGPDHSLVASPLNGLAQLYSAQGKYKQAEPLYQRALAIVEQQLGPEHPHTATARKNYNAFVRKIKRKGKGNTNTSSQ
jgi:tetratricopeptide (TPR) repeat protein